MGMVMMKADILSYTTSSTEEREANSSITVVYLVLYLGVYQHVHDQPQHRVCSGVCTGTEEIVDAAPDALFTEWRLAMLPFPGPVLLSPSDLIDVHIDDISQVVWIVGRLVFL